MSVLVGKKAPMFTAAAVINGEEIVKDFSLEQYIGKKHIVLFFYPKDFTFVCPTELHAFQTALKDFESRNVQVIGCSTDTENSHFNWLQMPKEKGGIQGVTYPLVADTSKTIATNYDVLFGTYDYNDEGQMTATGPMIAFRGLFLIDKEGIVQHQSVNHLSVGRNVDEVIRMVDAVQHVETKGEVCPANWEKGKDAMEDNLMGVTEYLSVH